MAVRLAGWGISHLSFRPSFHPSTHPSIHPSIHLSIVTHFSQFAALALAHTIPALPPFPLLSFPTAHPSDPTTASRTLSHAHASFNSREPTTFMWVNRLTGLTGRLTGSLCR